MNDKSADTKSKIPEEKSPNSISNFKVAKRLAKNLKKQSITTLFDIQAKSFNTIYDGKDFIGRARTGQGKTLAFVLPIMSRIINAREKDKDAYRVTRNAPLVLVLCPVRELASQVAKVFETTCGSEISVCTVFGGVPYAKQMAELRRGVEVVIGTCGRVKDLLDRETLSLEKIEFVVLDEVDEMLNIGFANDVEEILSQTQKKSLSGEKNKNEDPCKIIGQQKQPEKKNHQVMLFSATLPKWVHGIARKYLEKAYVELDLVGSSKLQTSDTIKHLALCSIGSERNSVLANLLEAELGNGERAIIFAERKNECNELAQGALKRLSCRVLHGDIPQKDRTVAIEGFRKGEFNILVATDVAARGINVPGVALVVQIEPPRSHETYVHRSGRTGRAGADGRSVLIYAPPRGREVQEIERKAKITFERIGCPTSGFLVKNSIEKFKKVADSLPDSARDMLLPYVKELLESKERENTENFIMAALAHASGGKEKFLRRSMLCGKADLITVCVRADKNCTEQNLRKACAEVLDRKVDNAVTYFNMFRDEKGAVFDLNERIIKSFPTEKEFDSREVKGKVKFEIVERLPPLKNFGLVGNQNNRRGRNFRGSFNGRQWNQRGRKRSYGQGRPQNRHNGRDAGKRFRSR